MCFLLGGPENFIVGYRRGMHMAAVWIPIFIAVLVFACGLGGLYLQGLLPEPQSERSRDMISAVLGLITLLLALVLGTIVGSAYGRFTMQNAEMENLSTRALQLDLALAEYGPETEPFRAKIKEEMSRAYRLFWRSGNDADSDPAALKVSAALPKLREADEFLASLNPQTPGQRQAAASAATDAGWIQNIRIGMSLQLASSVPWPLLVVVVAWSLLLFFGFGLRSRFSATTVAALGFGAFAIASAIFLILDLSEPYTGLFRVPPAALLQTIEALNR
jgi:hypothetical protein